MHNIDNYSMVVGLYMVGYTLEKDLHNYNK